MSNPEFHHLRDIHPFPDDDDTLNRFAGKTVLMTGSAFAKDGG